MGWSFRIIMGICCLLVVYHGWSIGQYLVQIEKMSNGPGISPEGSLEIMLIGIHSSFLLFTIAIPFAHWLGTRSKVVVLSSVLCGITGIYIWWYLEKFEFVEKVYGLRSESTEYTQWLEEIGLMRGATPIDYAVMGITGVLVLLTVAHLLVNPSTRRQLD